MNPQTKQFCFVAMLFSAIRGWQESGQPQAWVDARCGQYLLSDWLVVGS